MNVDQAIRSVMGRLMRDASKRGISENFGQREYRTLVDTYGHFPGGSVEERATAKKLDSFEDWACTYTGR